MLSDIKNLPQDPEARAISARHGLTICSVTWEDTARSFGSSVGPNITDMTIRCKNQRMPVFRKGSNYKDLTFDMPIENVSMLIGNNRGNDLVPMQLADVLKDVRLVLGPIDYFEKNTVKFHDKVTCDACGRQPIGEIRYRCLECNDYDLCNKCNYEQKETLKHRSFHSMRKTVEPEQISGVNQGQPINLFSEEKDKNVLMSCQSAFLPIEKNSSGTEFAVEAFNYQGSVLAITCCSKGSSATLLGNSATKLYHNDNGEKKEFWGQRLMDDRRERGVQLTGEMTHEEKIQNVIIVIQIPLKYEQRVSRGGFYSTQELNQYQYQKNWLIPNMAMKASLDDDCVTSSGSSFVCYEIANKADDDDFNECYTEPQWTSNTLECHSLKKKSKRKQEKKEDVDHVIVKLGESKGRFEAVKASRLERDHNYPIRVTVQFYKGTENGVFSDNLCQEMLAQFKSAANGSIAQGSLVVESNKRTTNSQLSSSSSSSSNPVFSFLSKML